MIYFINLFLQVLLWFLDRFSLAIIALRLKLQKNIDFKS